MSPPDETCRRVQAYLKLKCQASTMKAPDDWVDGCVECYRNLHRNSTTNMQELMEFVKQQWLLADFEQLTLKSLPVNLQRSTVINLTENYVLQLLYIINIGQSAYSQHSKITKGLESNAEVSADKKIPSKWEPKTRRMLLLHLTDGTQAIQAMEYVQIPHLHLDLIPGTKIVIKGPAECRRGVILLRPNNIELLGGEVSDLVQPNAPENVLARAVNKPENPNPVYGNYSVQTAATAEMDCDEDDEFASSGVSCRTGQPAARPRNNMPPPGSAGPSKRCLVDARAEPPAKKSARPPPEDEIMFPDDDDDDIFLMADMPESASMERPVEAARPAPVQPPARPPIVRPFSYIYVHLERRAKGLCSPSETLCVKGFVSTIRSKLEAKAGQWRLSATINDGSAALDVDFSPDVLNGLIGHTPLQLKSMIEKEEDKLSAQQAVERARLKLIELNCLMHIRWPAEDAAAAGQPARPVVFRLEGIQRRHLEMLQLL